MRWCSGAGRVAGELSSGEITEERLYTLEYGTPPEGVKAA